MCDSFFFAGPHRPLQEAERVCSLKEASNSLGLEEPGDAALHGFVRPVEDVEPYVLHVVHAIFELPEVRIGVRWEAVFEPAGRPNCERASFNERVALFVGRRTGLEPCGLLRVAYGVHHIVRVSVCCRESERDESVPMREFFVRAKNVRVWYARQSGARLVIDRLRMHADR